METTVSFFPSSRDLKEKIRFPLGAAVSPTMFESCDILPHSARELHTCRKCGAYLSPNCPVTGNFWQCAFCNLQNEAEINDAFQNQTNKSAFEVLLGKKTNINIIYTIYISLSLEEPDFLRAKVFACSLLRNLPENGKCVVLLGMDDPGFAILVPPLLTKDNEKSCAAAIIRTKSIRALVGKDLRSFFFTRETAFMAERTIEKLTRARDSNPHAKIGDFAQVLSSFVQNLMPIRFIAILQNITRSAVDFETLRQSLVRLDIVVIEHTPALVKFASELPGTVEFLSNRSISIQAKHLIEQDTKFQVIFKCNSSRCRTEVVRPPRPFNDMYESALFLPVIPTKDFPLMVEISPAQEAKSIALQFVSKFVVVRGSERHFVLRVSNHTFRTTNDAEEYANAINWNCALWFWLRKVYSMSRSDATAAIFKTVASIRTQIGDKVPEDVIKAICALPKADIFCEREEKSMRAIDLLLYSFPCDLSVIPRISENSAGRNMCCSINGVYEARNEYREGPSKDARSAQLALPVYIPISSMIPQEFLTSDPISHSIFERFQSRLNL